ncbi:MAG: PorV/PorQ family protein [Bacteroidetes bacterium]|nr:PorV/PorQ family protein [Bacteroidota bacterium]
MAVKFKNITILLILILISGTVYSGPRKKLGLSAAPELLIPVGSVGTALQGSNLASTEGIDAMYWNPAGLSTLSSDRGEFMFSHNQYIADIKIEYLAGVVKLGNIGNLGVGIKAMNFGEELVTTVNYPEGDGSTFKPLFLTANLSFARAMTDKIHFGATLKLINQNIAEVSATGYAFDFGLQYIGGKTGLRFGIAIKNLGTSMKFNGSGLDRTYTDPNGQVARRVNLAEFDLPTNLEIGVSYNFGLDKGKHNFMIGGTFMNGSFNSDEARLGLEYNFNKIIYLRGAYVNYLDGVSGDNLWGPTFGVGLRYPFGAINVGLDYAYKVVNESAFNSNQYFTLHVGF